MPSLSTARLELRQLHEGDLDAFADICADAEAMRYSGVRLFGTALLNGRDHPVDGCDRATA